MVKKLYFACFLVSLMLVSPVLSEDCGYEDDYELEPIEDSSSWSSEGIEQNGEEPSESYEYYEPCESYEGEDFQESEEPQEPFNSDIQENDSLDYYN